MVLVYILIGILALTLIVLIYRVVMLEKERDFTYHTLVFEENGHIVFKGKKNEDDFVIKRVDDQLITGIKKGNDIIQKSVI